MPFSKALRDILWIVTIGVSTILSHSGFRIFGTILGIAVLVCICLGGLHLYRQHEHQSLNEELYRATLELYATADAIRFVEFPLANIERIVSAAEDSPPVKEGDTESEEPESDFFGNLIRPEIMEQSLQEKILHRLRKHVEKASSRPKSLLKMGIFPTHGRISSPYGRRYSPFGGRSREFHHGLDIATRSGMPIFCMWPGIVTRARWAGDYGLMVEVYHGKSIITRYAHMSRILVPHGKYVTRGQILGLVGSTGRSTGPHVHFEIRFRNKSVDPLKYILMEYASQEARKKGGV